MSLILNDSEEIEKFLEAVVSSEEEKGDQPSFRIATFLTKKQLGVVNFICNIAILSTYANFTWRLYEVGEGAAVMGSMLTCFSISALLFAVSTYKKNSILTNTLTAYSLLLLSLFLYAMAVHIRFKIQVSIDDQFFDNLELAFRLQPEATKASFKASLTNDVIYGQLYVIINVGSFASIFLFFLFYDRFSKTHSLLTFSFCIAAGVLISYGDEKFREQASLVDVLFYCSLLAIVGAVKCYLFWMTDNVMKKNQHLSKIKEFYQNWVTQSKMSYILIKDKKMTYTNEKSSSRSLLESLEIYESHDDNLSIGDKFSQCICKIEGSSTSFETKAIVRQRSFDSHERFFECLVKNYSIGYSEIILIDNTSIVKTEKKKVEQEYSNMLFAKIAHEFKTPLNNIQLLSEQLADQIESKEVNMIQNLSRYMFYLVKDMSDYFQRGRKTEIEVVKKEINLTEVCEFCFEVAESLVSLNSDKKDFLKVKFKNLVGEAKILGDQVRIQQVLLNLLSNSIKFTFAGEVTLRLEKDSKGYCVAVIDTGKGMNEEMLSKVLSLDGSLQIRSEYNEHGTGLGLSIVQDIIKAMEFSFEMKSEVGSGTAASICIPSIEEEESNSLNETQIGNFPLFLSPNMRILDEKEEGSDNSIFIVDDNALNRTSMVRVLTKIKKLYGKNWSFVTLSDGAHLLSSLISHLRQGLKIKAVITDEYMEVLNGSAAVEIMRNLEKDGKIPRIKCFSYSSFENTTHFEKVASKGIDDVIPKPGGMEDVLAVLSRHELV